MGASESLAKTYNIVQIFNDFVSNIRKDLLDTSNEPLKQLTKQAESLFSIYETIEDQGNGTFYESDSARSLDSYFQSVVISLLAFSDCINFIMNTKKNRKGAGIIDKVTKKFKEDFPKFINQLIKISNIALNILLEVRKNKLKEPLLFLELNIYNYALNAKKIANPPYYEITTMPAYELHNVISITDKQKLNITAPHGTGKTSLIPLFLACRMTDIVLTDIKCEEKFVIVVEHQTSSIQNIKNMLRQICLRDDEISEYDEDNDTFTFTTSFARILKYNENVSSIFYPVIGILSPLDALKLLHSVPDMKKFISRSIFVLDDAYLRTVETDVFVQDIKYLIPKNKEFPRFVMMSSIPESAYINTIGNLKELLIKSKRLKVDVEKVQSKNIKNIRNKELFESMKNFFDKWIDDKDTPIGSVVVFVPSEKIGRRVYKDLFSLYKKENAASVCPLKTSIKKGETPEDFYVRLFDDMIIAQGEIPEEISTLFLMPMLLSENVSPEERNLINSQLPLNFDKLARVFITTIKNEPILQIKDLMVIFDSGIHEVEFYNPDQSAIHICEQLLPSPYIDEHINLLKNCQGGKYFQFMVENDDKKRPKALIPDVKKSDLGKHILILRSFGVKLERQNNLPNEPDHDIRDKCFSILKKINVIDDTTDQDLTPLGIEASKFSFVSPFFAVATTKFKENQVFAFLCSLIIEHSRSLIINPQSELLCKHFNKDSDVVTLLGAVYEATKETITGYDDLGLSIGTLHMIYTQIESVFNDKQGRISVIESIDWARGQAGGIFGMVNKFVLLLDKENFLDKRKGEFVHIVGAGPGYEPTLVFKANEIFGFDSEKEKEIKSKIEVIRRPGWLGLQTPGNVYVLSLIVDEQSEFNRGLIIHKDTTAENEKARVVSVEIDNPCLNSFFFVSLFEGYWSGHSTINDFVGIYHTQEPKKESAFLIHITYNNKKTFLNYCPLNKDIEDTMLKAIPLLCELMPFVPRSLIAKVDVPLCAVEVVADGNSCSIHTRIDLIDNPDDEYLPLPYPINKDTLEFAKANITALKKTVPQIRFAITGESFYYKSINGIEEENDLIYPDVNPSIKGVFDPYHPSHLVLLVNKEYANKPASPQLKWIPNEADIVKNQTDDSKQNEMIISVISKMMTGIGYASHKTDVFFVTLGGGFLTVEEGEIPEVIRNKIGFKDGQIKLGIYPLIRYFINEFTRKQKLAKPITLKRYGSTNSWANYPTDEGARNNLCNQISKAVSNHFHLENDKVDAIFIGHSLLAIRVQDLPANLVAHKIYTKNFDESYYPCQADTEITQVLNDIKTVDFQIKQVIHEPVINVSIYHMKRMGISKENFIEKVKNTYDCFGFLRTTDEIDYQEPFEAEQIRRGILGIVDADFYGMPTGLAFATEVIQQFPMRTSDCYTTRTLRTCRGMETINPRLPPIDDSNALFKISPAEAEILKNKIAAKGDEWNIDKNYNVIKVPASEEEAARDMIRKIRNKDEDTTCIGVCEPPQTLLPQSLYAYQRDGTVRAIAICRDCMIDTFQNNESLQNIIDPLTHVIVREKLAEYTQQLSGFAFIDGNDIGDESWPIVPIGQSFWALMSDPETFGPDLKSWFTAVIDYSIRTSAAVFTHCPNHPDILIRVPKENISVRCQLCDMFYHYACRKWHKMDLECKEVDDGIKFCPNCNYRTYKYDGCNHITCPNCHKHWCYACKRSQVYETGNEVYQHMNAVHGGYYARPE